MDHIKFSENEYKLYVTQKEKSKFDSPEEEYEKHSSLNSKICSKCEKNKKLVEYRGNTSGCDGFDRHGYRLRRPECMDCTMNANKGKLIAKKYAKEHGMSLTPPEGTVCEICGVDKPGDKLVFDHCHRTNRFRGWVHNSCNRSVGVLGDDVESILKVFNYLNKTENVRVSQEEDGTLVIRCLESLK